MSITSHPFRVIEEYESVLKLPYLFGPDTDILEVNLSDSTNGNRIKVPGRGCRCDHIDVVDVCNSTHATNEGDIDWICPVCGNEYTQTNEIEVDGLILSIIAELDAEQTNDDTRAINLKITGEWTHVSDDPTQRVPIVRKKRPRLTLAQATAVAGLSGKSGEIVLSDSEDAVPHCSKDSKRKVEQVIVDLDSD
jgi:hypothetical protein